MKITRDMYRLALHFYLKHAYPDDDAQYYSKWAWLVSPAHDFWERDKWTLKDETGEFPREVRFGCHVSGNTKLRCYATGFMFDANDGGDPQEICKEVRRIQKAVEDEWRAHGLPVHGDRFKEVKKE